MERSGEARGIASLGQNEFALASAPKPVDLPVVFDPDLIAAPRKTVEFHDFREQVVAAGVIRGGRAQSRRSGGRRRGGKRVVWQVERRIGCCIAG